MKKIILISVLSLSTACGFSQQKLTLDECLSHARQYNHDLRMAEHDITAARDQKKEAFTMFFPKVQAYAAAFQLFERIGQKYDETSGSMEITEEQISSAKDIMGLMFNNWSTNLDILTGTTMDYKSAYSSTGFNRAYAGTVTAVQPIFMGGQIINGNKLASVGIDAAKLKQVMKEKEVLQKVTECFWKLATVKFNMNTVEAAEKQIAVVRKRVEDLIGCGVITENNLLRVKLREQELASTKLKLENGDELLRLLLAQLIGMADVNIDIMIPDTKEMPLLPAYAGDDSYSTRAELELAGKGVEAEKLKLKMEVGKYLPKLTIGVSGIGAGYNFDHICGYTNVSATITQIKDLFPDYATKSYNYAWTTENDMKRSKFTGFAFATISIPISDWWGGSHAIHRQKIRKAQAEERYLDVKEKLALDNKSTWLKVTEAYKQISIAKTSVEEAEENLRMHTEQYENGTTPLTDVLDAETLNRKAHNQLATSIADYQVRLADYQRKITR